MTTRNRSIQRTPRKDKSWAYHREGGQTLPTNTVFVQTDLLTDYLAEIGLDESRKLTVMRIVGHIDLGNGASATAATSFECFWGIAWVSGAVAILPSADPSIPDPAHNGVAQARWIQTGSLGTLAVPGALRRGADDGNLRASVSLDIKQMRKQELAGDRLVLIIRSVASTSENAALWYDFRTMLALP